MTGPRKPPAGRRARADEAERGHVRRVWTEDAYLAHFEMRSASSLPAAAIAGTASTNVVNAIGFTSSQPARRRLR